MINPITKDLIEVVKYFVSILQPDNYLELGLYKGETITYVKDYVKKQCIGVDISIPQNKQGYIFYNLSTNVFFEKISQGQIQLPKLDIVFIDADHSYKQSLKDFNNVFSYVNDQGLIFLHDTFPKNKDFTNSGYCGDTYKIVYDLRNRIDCELITLPVHPGLTLVRKRNNHLLWQEDK